ncbi:MAG TPA: hypothetical protein DE060_09180 [Lentisphaeria bacterium]|nr:hypothetical protein [Lentisphaeria bacterium]HCG49357.1 hypothetical protein [Lentisphaeria bacterium]
MSIRDKFWMWGYTMEHGGMALPFAPAEASYCSLENAADYFGMPNVIFMNTMHSFDRVEENLAFLKHSGKIICGLPHGEENALFGAERISELSEKFPNIHGIVLDDFLQLSGHSTTPELVRRIREKLHTVNPRLEIYVVMYSDMNHLELSPYLELIDGIILWRWISTEHFWRAEFGPLLHRTKVHYQKKLFHGIYLQNYGEYSSSAHPIDFELWKLQWMRVLTELRSPYAFLDGCVLLQNAWVDNPEFRDHVIWLKETLEWFFHTATER